MLFESELKVMKLLWQYGNCYASELANHANENYKWNKNTTYTIIKKLVDKGYIQRVEPKFYCVSLISQDQEQAEATLSLIDRLYEGSVTAFFSHLVTSKELSKTEFDDLVNLIENTRNEKK